MTGKFDIISVDKVDDSIFKALEQVYVAELRIQTPKKTGATAKGWSIRRLGDFSYMIYNPRGDIIHFLNDDIPSHEIVARKKKFLMFELDQSVTPSGKYRGKVYPIKKGNLVMWINKKTRKMEFGIVTKGSKKFLLIKKVLHPGHEAMNFIKNIMENEALYGEFEKKFVDGLMAE